MVKQILDLMSVLPSSSYEVYNADTAKISGLCIDSRQVKAGDLFFALQGENFNAAAFVETVIAKGVQAICCDKTAAKEVVETLPENFPLIVVESLLANLSLLANTFYGAPSEKMHVVAITGTDGKTSVSHYVAQMLEKSVVVGTMGNGFLHDLQTASHTTPDAITLQALMQEFYQANASTVSMEASSHGLAQGRLSAIHVDTAVLTNFSRDHLDYHGSLAEYKAAKKILFTQFSPKNIVVNYDDEFGREIYTECNKNSQCNLIAYAIESKSAFPALLNAEIIKTSANGFKLKVSYAGSEEIISLPLLGQFNIENALAVIAVMLVNGIAFQDACQRIQTIRAITGRMQSIDMGKQSVVIDYAHTPQALRSVLNALQLHCSGQVLCVFGCGGDRDKGKRPLMAEAASKANYVVVTNDNPRTENPVAIVDDICAGFKEFKHYEIEYDRAKAIRLAIDKAKQDDIVLIAGKGHERYQIIGQQKLAYSDEAVVRDYMGVAA